MERVDGSFVLVENRFGIVGGGDQNFQPPVLSRQRCVSAVRLRNRARLCLRRFYVHRSAFVEQSPHALRRKASRNGLERPLVLVLLGRFARAAAAPRAKR